ncbi:MAG: SDR family NAD(P)-dependent oxidoreductase [Clostridium sp.]|nr:SDR family NAD(P)-dependent oxidoreductase [Clostridium sp.]
MSIAIITGASSGMGKEFTRQMFYTLRKTDEIWLLSRNKDSVKQLAHDLVEERKKRIVNVEFIKMRPIEIDLTDEKDMERFEKRLMKRKASISVLINCAGCGVCGPFFKQSREEVEQMVRLNVLALTQMTKICLPYMKRGSKIVQMASGAGFRPQADFAAYAASKAYVYIFGRTLYKELKRKGITVTTVCPGPVNTPFLDKAYGQYKKMSLYKKWIMAEPEDVVLKALLDCKNNKPLSVYGLPMNLLYRLTKGLMG